MQQTRRRGDILAFEARQKISPEEVIIVQKSRYSAIQTEGTAVQRVLSGNKLSIDEDKDIHWKEQSW